MKLKTILLVLLVIITAGVITGYIMLNKPHAKVEDRHSIAISATALADSFANNETNANASFLNKALTVSGTITDVTKNQDGGTVVLLKTNDPTFVIECGMRDKQIDVQKETTVTIEGFCSGKDMLSVNLTGCIIKK